MPIETTSEAVRPLAAARGAIGNAEQHSGKRGGPVRRAVEKTRRYAALALAVGAALLSRAWSRKRTRLPSRTMTVLGWIAVIAVCGYVGLTAMIYFAQRSLMYFPDRTHVTPAAAGLPEATEVPLTASDGVQIRVWHVPPQAGKPVILYFHGNGGALNYRVERFRRLIGAGIGLVALEYRGYGGLSGSPSERGLIRDAEAAYAFAAAHYPAKEIVLWGESLGSGVAVALAAEKPVGRIILEAPFTSALAIGERRYWYLPVRLLMEDQFRSDQRIKKVTAPLLILHGVHDRVVPFAMGERLFELANKPKHIVRFLDGGHEDLDKNGALDAVARFLAGDLD
ncbi:MAG TPA: alpha/beta hydrolase [Xanthobacteraceae bacterium]|nr:alpha/beta hydrolase [Xanthobacteraceae bacterium]